MELSETQKKYLRRLGHDLKPLIMVGDAGLTEALMAEYNSTLAHHELIKVKLRGADRESRDAMIASLCDEHSTELIQRIGNVALIYRPNHDKKRDKRLRIPSS